MRIAMIGSRGIPARAGGIERVVEELTRELSARGHEVFVYGRRHYIQDDGKPQAGRLILTAGLDGKHLDTITHTATAMLDVLRRQVDVVHLHSPGPALLSWIPAAAGLPLVLTVHAPDWQRDKWSPPAKAMLRAGLACGMRLARAVTAVSRSLAEELSRRYRREVFYVPNAMRPLEPRSPQAVSQWGLKPFGYALYVGRVVPEKRLHLLLEAWKILDRSHLLVVAGDHRQGRYAKACCRLAGPNVLFVGPQYGQALAGLYSNAALVVQPSVLEGMSLVLLEAAAHGRCILAARIPPNLEAMGDCILYFDKDNVSQLAEQIERCLKDSELARSLGLKAKKHVERSFSWRSAAEQMERIYRQAMKGRQK